MSFDGAMSFDGKVALVTGAARGLGQAYAQALAAEGAAVVVGDMRDCGETVALVEKAGGRVRAVELDVADMASCQAMADAAVESFGRIDGLVNNAALYGALNGGRFEDIDPAEWDAAMAVNVKGIWQCCKAAVPAMREAGGGSIVNVASLAANYGMPYALHYTTSKGAVIGLTRGLARELGTADIRVNAVSPSAVTTEGTAEMMGEHADRSLAVIAQGQCFKRNLGTEDLVGAILFLLGDGSRYITGQTLMVDGGTVFL